MFQPLRENISKLAILRNVVRQKIQVTKFYVVKTRGSRRRNVHCIVL